MKEPQEKEYWAFLSPDRKILPTTIRQRAGDAGAALRSLHPLTTARVLSDCILARVKVSVVREEPRFRYVDGAVRQVTPTDRFAGWEGEE